MKIGIDARELQGHPTGTGRYLRSLLRIWTVRGEDKLVAYFNGAAPDDALLAHPGLAVRELPAARGVVWQERVLPRAARHDALDVFFSPAYTCPLELEVPRVTAVHDFSFFSLPEDFSVLDGARRRALVGASIRASRAVLACSAFTRREIAARFPNAADRVVHVPLGPDEDLPPPPPRDAARRRLGTRGPSLVSVGAILNRRRLPELIRAAARVSRRQPRLLLDVIGENRTHPPLDLAALARSAGLDQGLRLSGFVSEAALADRYAAADVAVSLSEYEGFGLPVLEAMSRGVPVVLARRPAQDEIFGEAAVLVEPRDVSGIGDAIERVLADRTLRADLIARGQALARQFSWAETARQTREVLARAAQG